MLISKVAGVGTFPSTLFRRIVSYVCNAASLFGSFPGGLDGKLPAMQETQVRPLGQEDPLEKEMATHSNILAWKIPWTEEPGGLHPMGLQRVGHD